MPDLRELFDNPDEAFRSMWAGLQRHLHTAMVARVTEASDGKTVVAQPTIKQAVQDPTLTQTNYVDYPLLLDQPAHFVGGAGVTLTHGIGQGDEILSIFASRPIDTWFQSSGTQQPIADRTHSLSDGIALPGLRSQPRELKQISTSSAQLRSDDKLHVVDHHPQSGTTIHSSDPSTAPASDSFDPFTMAAKFYRHIVQGAAGILGSATDGGTTHEHGVTHADGAFMRAVNGLHAVLAHPTLGGMLSALNGAHTVQASPTGVVLSSVSGIDLDCPPGMLSLPSGGVGAGALGSGAAASNVGALGGDLAGELPNPQVVSIAHLVGMDQLPRAASDAAAAALTPPVPIGSPYLNTTAISGASLLCIRTV